MRPWLVPLCLGWLAPSGCGGASGPPPDPDDYDAVCAVVDDCRAVFDQAFDCGCTCGTLVALSVGGAEAFDADQAAYEAPTCRSECALECAVVAPEDAVLDCVNATCSIVEVDAGSDPEGGGG